MISSDEKTSPGKDFKCERWRIAHYDLAMLILRMPRMPRIDA